MAYAAWILLKLTGIMVFIFVSNLSAFFIHAPLGKMAESGVFNELE